jgi:hypothetical protein
MAPDVWHVLTVRWTDPGRFAGFPDGVPEGTPFGTFFGRQAHCYLRDLGFDYIWFSKT